MLVLVIHVIVHVAMHGYVRILTLSLSLFDVPHARQVLYTPMYISNCLGTEVDVLKAARDLHIDRSRLDYRIGSIIDALG